MKNIHKHFGGVIALRGVDFTVGDNEVIGLIGDNGAGKSTLQKVLSGLYPPTKGEIYIRGKKIHPRNYSVKKAHKLGIETVFQEKALGEKQALWRNVFLGRQPVGKLGFLDVDKAKSETDRIMKEFLGFTGAGISPESMVSTLSGGERQGVAIGRAMYFEADLIILDEPTNALSVKEIGKVLDFRGKSCVYISHTIAHIYEVSDRFVILDKGRVVDRRDKGELSEEELIDELTHHAAQSESGVNE